MPANFLTDEDVFPPYLLDGFIPPMDHEDDFASPINSKLSMWDNVFGEEVKIIYPPEKTRRTEIPDDERNERITNCGHVTSFTNPVNGRRAIFSFYCNQIRQECERCIQRLALKHLRRITKAIEEQEKMLRKFDGLTKEQVDELIETNNLEKYDYARYPQKNQTEILIVDDNKIEQHPDKFLGDAFELDDINMDDFTEWVQSPKKRNKSGLLGVPPKTDDGKVNVTYHTRIPTQEIPKELEMAAWKHTYIATSHLLPEYTEGCNISALLRRVTDACQLRQDTYVKYLEENGVEFTKSAYATISRNFRVQEVKWDDMSAIEGHALNPEEIAYYTPGKNMPWHELPEMT